MKSGVAFYLCGVVALLLSGCDTTPDAAGPDATSQQPQVAEDPLEVGEKLYGQYCFSCHAAGLSGAPKLGDAEAWAPRAAKGSELLLKTTIDGVPPAMPPRGLCLSCSDAELAAIIEFMLVRSR